MLSLAAGAKLADGRFLLARLLGAGGLGQVWLAQDTHSDRRVALKILAPEYASHPGALELLRREFAHQQSVVGHPHILPLHELVESEAGLVLVMPHASGGDAGQLRGAPWQRLLPVLSQVAAALEHAHARGVVHRDLKCTNVLLDDRGAAQLSDFGHAQVIGAAAEQRSHGGGTPGTMSPQQLEGAAPSPADDLYAYGVLCFELLTGELPFAPAEAASRLQRPPASLAGRVEGLPAALIELVEALLADSPSARPASMTAVGEVLARLKPQDDASADTLWPADRKHDPAAQDTAAYVLERQDDEDMEITPLRPRRRRASASDPSTGTRPGNGATRASTAGGPPASTPSRGLPGGPREWSIAAFVLLLALLLATVFWLPQLGAPRLPEAPLVVTTPPPDADEAAPIRPASGEPPPRQEDAAALREQAEAVLGRLVTLQNRLTPLQPGRWASEDWSQATTLGQQGDDELLARRFREATQSYERALELLASVEARIPAVYQAAMQRGAEAISEENQSAAVAAYQRALLVRPDDNAAEAGLARSQRLNEVLAQMAAGRRAEAAGNLGAAAQAFARTLELDGEWRPAREGLARVRRQQADTAFAAMLSRGYSALAAERYADAITAFEEALSQRPEAADARDGLAQAQEGRRLQQIGLAQVRATAFERQERWEEALAQYRAALEIDSALGFARQGRARAEERASLDAKLAALIATPSRLFDDRILAEARALLVEADETLRRAGGQKLEQQVMQLSNLLELATTPVEVELISDGRTRVRVFRVGDIGRFERTTLQLRPGDYTIIGSRDGYRDVRVTVSVRPGRTPDPVAVINTEII